MKTRETPLTRFATRCLGVVAMAVAGVAVCTPAAWADPASGPTIVGPYCMQTTYSGDTAEPIPSSVALNCTAGDIRIARATSVDPTTCIEGEVFDLEATFEVNVTANERYDAGFYFNTTGGANARLGTCSLSVLDPDLAPALQLDNDFCGDLNAGTYYVTFDIPDVLCQRAPGTNLLRLPNCTAWHNNWSTGCSENVEADPDTKSKCRCDDNFTVPVIVEDATISVVKDATPDNVPETGGEVTYSVKVTNNASYVSVEILTIVDDIYGNLHEATNPNVTANTCPLLLGEVLDPAEWVTCSFKAWVEGDYKDVVTDIVEVCGKQTNTGATGICDDDDAEVYITDVPSTPSVEKESQAAANCQLDATYQVVVTNSSAIDTMWVKGLSDNMFGDITQDAEDEPANPAVLSTTCGKAAGALPYEIPIGGNYTCEFTGRIISTSCTFTHTNTVTADLEDEDEVPYSPSDSSSVHVETTVDLQE